MGKKARLKQARREARDCMLRSNLELLVQPGCLQHIRDGILKSGARVDSCILSTKILCELAERGGLRAVPLVVECLVLNPQAARANAESVDGLEGLSDLEMQKLGEAGGRFLVLGYREPTTEPNKWPGHLVAVVSCGGMSYIVDLSADQAHRPAKGILIPGPLAFPLEHAEFLRGEITAHLEAPNGAVMVYTAHPQDESFRSLPDWVRTPEISFRGISQGL